MVTMVGPLILTGASRGIGRALLSAVPPSVFVHTLARGSIEARPNTTAHPFDLARDVLLPLPRDLRGATLVHCAGLWPEKRELVDGLERAWVVNCAAPLSLTQALLAEKGYVKRILVIGAGLMIKGQVSARTPTGDDFHWMGTYASTKLAFAIAMRDVAAMHPAVEVAVMHPGVVRTDLGDRGGPLGFLVRQLKRLWESPDVTGARLATFLARETWSSPRVPGEARWFFKDRETPWPEVVTRDAAEVRAALTKTPPRRMAFSV
jgi:NAD(P)-dependent dehydrogenase (short-subunit alcohol dehydrogenase family)